MKVAITAPAGPVVKDKLIQGISLLKSLGFNDIVVGDTCHERFYWNSSSALERVAEFEMFWTDPEIDLVWAARGGFGCIHLLDKIDWSKIQSHTKVLCGHSDLTVLHLAFQRFNVKSSVSGLMPAVEFASKDLDELSIENFRDSLKLKLPQLVNALSPLKKGECSGFLMPVTLSVLCSLIGTDYMPSLKGALLIIEDVNEPAYRLDGYLSQLHLCGILNDIHGLIWGDFNDCGTKEELDHIYQNFSVLVNGPVASGLEFGHCLPRVSLPVGVNVKFVVNEDVLIESVVL